MAENRLVSFSLLFLAAVAAATLSCNGQAHGSDICDKADYVRLCRFAVKGSNDPRVALKNTIEVLMSQTESAKASSQRLGNSQFIAVCTENFDSAIDDLVKSLQYLESNDKASLQSSLTGSLSFYVTCKDTLVEGGDGVMKLASNLLIKDDMLQRMGANSLYLASLLR
ncbi:uncharacterized protein LOC111481993 [Cucurbita maxima]|uniref:Uncharacterized protein LOC111481993 n=1 Tax=Cucurbita maxima TaxID=3661 RepID=A0A6J1J7M1_CUCMA|nr:uncharacterized protein LOC111481993 [Cucurbita maxima]